MDDMKKLYVILFWSVFILSCSLNDVTPELAIQEVKFTAMNKHEFISLVDNKCSDLEREFLDRLPENIEICVFETDAKQYAKLEIEECDKLISILNSDENLVSQVLSENFDAITRLKTKAESGDDFYDNVLRNPGGVHGGGGGGNGGGNGGGSSHNIEDSEIKVARGMTITVAYLSSFIWGNVSSSLNATLNYEYDLVTHKVLNATGIICDIVSEGSFSIDGIVFDWADLGSTLSVDSDREGLIYNINGNIIVGKTIADFPAGFVVEKYRSLTGAVLVPWE